MDELTQYLIETEEIKPCDICGVLNNVADLIPTDEGNICQPCEECR